MRTHMIRIDATSAVKALEPGGGVLTSAGWKPVSVENLYRMERVDQPVDQPVMRRTREQQLAALIARMNQGDQTALAELYDETNTLVYSLALRILH
jgi:hypothetical protein